MKKAVLIASLLVIGFGIWGVFTTLHKSTPKNPSTRLSVDPQALLDQTIDKMLSVKSLTQAQKANVRSAFGSAGPVNSVNEESLVHYDFSAASANMDIHLTDQSGDQFKIISDFVVNRGIAYGNIRSVSGVMADKLFGIDPAFQGYINKWFPLNQGGVVGLEGASINIPSSQNVLDMAKISSLKSGQFVFGNFSADQRQLLEDLIKRENVYQRQSVEEKTLNGQKYVIYSVKVNNNGVVKLNQQVASFQAREMASKDLQELYNFKADRVELWVDPKTHELLKIVEKVAGINVGDSLTNYSDYDKTSAQPAPVPELSLSDMEKIYSSFSSAGF